MAGNDANWWWVIGPDRRQGPPWVQVQSHMAPDMSVRLGKSETGRLIVTGLRIGAPEGAAPYEIKSLRAIHLGEVLREIRAAAAIDDPWWQASLTGGVDKTTMTVRRGPVRDEDMDRRTRELYEAALASGRTKTEAVMETAVKLGKSESQVYRRLARTRSQPKEAR